MASTGSGTLYNLIARIAFLASGYALQFSMARWLGSPAEYGRFGVLLSLVTLARVLLSAGVPQAISQFVAADPSAALGIYRRGEALQMAAACFVWAVFVTLTPALSRWLGDPPLRYLLWQVSPLIPLMALYQVGLGFIGGQLWFGWQALLTLIYSIARYVLAALLVLCGFGIQGAVWGQVAATAVVALWAWLIIPGGRPPSAASTKQFLAFSWPLVIFSFGVSALLNLDLLLLKRFFPSSPQVGFYSGAVNLGKAPYFVFYAFSTTTLPALARYSAQGDLGKVRGLLSRQMRFLLLAALPCAGILAATAAESLQLVYRGGYRDAAAPLALLSWSSCALSVMVVLASALTACGRPRLSMLLMLVSLPVQWLCGLWLIPKMGMSGAATSNLITTLIGLGVALAAVQRLIGNVIGFRVLGSSGVSTLLAFAALVALPAASSTWLIPKIVLGFAIYGIGLLLTGGVTRVEILQVSRRLLHGAERADRVF